MAIPSNILSENIIWIACEGLKYFIVGSLLFCWQTLDNMWKIWNLNKSGEYLYWPSWIYLWQPFLIIIRWCSQSLIGGLLNIFLNIVWWWFFCQELFWNVAESCTDLCTPSWLAQPMNSVLCQWNPYQPLQKFF